MLKAADIKSRAEEIGFDLCGVAPATEFPELQFLSAWLERGYAGEMSYMARTAAKRADVRKVLPSAKTVIALGTVYNVDRPYSTEIADRDRARISRYAWGADYHTVLTERTEALLVWMREASDVSFEAKLYVDTGPVQERVYAQHAGLGWIGKNTCLINPEIGSWLFLSEIICSLSLETDQGGVDQCGTCTLCLEACPTGAIVEPWVIDSTRCLSYLTIEVKGQIPEAHREAIGNHVYGCDICQDVCPFNATPAQSLDPAWQPNPALDQPRLVDLWQQPDESLRPIVERSAMSRAGVRGLRRNIAVALGNSGSRDAAVALRTPVAGGTPEDPLVDAHVSWGEHRLASTRTIQALAGEKPRSRIPSEPVKE